MKRILVATLAAAAAGTSIAAVTLVPTLTGPSELQLGAPEFYKLSVRNSGSTNATGVQIRMSMAPGMVPLGPWPSICSVSGPDFVCQTGSVPARKSREYTLVFQASPTLTQVFSHRLTASGTAAATTVSAPLVTDYRHFDIPFAGSSTALWEVRSCNGGTTGVAYNLCPASSEIVGDALLHPGGVMEDLTQSSAGYWLQTAPHNLRWDVPAVPGYMDAWYVEATAINSRCFRGGGQSVPTGTNAQYRTANKICLK